MNSKRKQALLSDDFDFGAALVRARKAAGMSQGDLSALVGTSKVTLGSWENNKSFPTQPDLIRLADVLRVPVTVFFPESVTAVSAEGLEALSIIQDFDPSSSRLAGDLLRAVQNHQIREQDLSRAAELREKFTFVEDTGNPDELRAAAGTGAGYGFFPDRFSFVLSDERTECANILFTVAGRSMEPRFEDGDRVYVRRSNDAENGQVILAYNGDDGFVIKMKKNEKLVSLNPDYPFEPSDPSQVRLYGVVTGKALPEDFCDPGEEAELRKVFEEDIRLYLQEEYGWEG